MAKLILPIHSHKRGQSIQSRLVNCYAEANPQGAKAPIGLRGCPGVTSLGTLPTTPYRGSGVFQGVLLAVGGNTLYKISSTGTAEQTGDAIVGTGRVSMAENRDGISIYTSDGHPDYVFTSLAALGTLLVITDIDKKPASLVDVIEGFAVHIRDGTDQFASSGLAASTAFDGLDFDTAAAEPDLLISLKTDHLRLVLFGTKTTEFWWVDGGSGFPLSRLPGGVIEQGCIAKYSPTKFGSLLGWLDHDRIVRVLSGAKGQKISTNWLDEEMRKVTNPQDIFGYTYTTEGHIFYSLTTDRGTFCWDSATREWSERKSLGLDRWRIDDVIKVYNKQVAFDSQSGQFGFIDETLTTEFGDPIRMEWTYPTVYAEGRLASHTRLETNLEVGTAAAGTSPVIGLLVSDDGGKTWDELGTRSVGKTGEYFEEPIWTNLGSSRNRVYRHFISDPIERFIADTQLEVQGGRL